MAEFFVVAGNGAGSFTSPVRKLLLHTTEGSSIEGSISAYRANNSWPHKTADFRFGHPYRVCTHLPDYVAARSLRNEPGGVQTNTDGVLQIEVVGAAAHPEAIDWVALGLEVLGSWARHNGILVQSSVEWVPYPQSYGTTARQRLSASAWTAYRGVLGHQHCPENTHGDPGAIPIAALLSAMRGTVPPPPIPEEEDDMPDYVIEAPERPPTHIVAGTPVKLPDSTTHTAAVRSVKPENVLRMTTAGYDAYLSQLAEWVKLGAPVVQEAPPLAG